MWPIKVLLWMVSLLCFNLLVLTNNVEDPLQTNSLNDHVTDDSDNNPLLDMAGMVMQMISSNTQNGGGQSQGTGLAAIATLFSSFMQNMGDGQEKSSGFGSGSTSGGLGALQILSSLVPLLAATGRSSDDSGKSNVGGDGGGGGGFDPSIIANMIDMFTQNDDGQNQVKQHKSHASMKREKIDNDLDFSSIIQVASTFLNQQQQQKQAQQQKQQLQQKQQSKKSPHHIENNDDNGSLIDLIPLIVQTIQSFTGPEGQRTQDKHKGHAWVLPPFLESIHILWDHFSNSKLGEALYERSGVNQILKGFKGADGKLEYDKLFESLNNQSFRRRWIKTATLYLADWASYLAKPEVYSQYFRTAQIMFNSFLQSQDYPKNTFFDPNRPSETISNLFDYVVKEQLDTKIDSRQYVKPAVAYAKQLLKLGQARGLLQFNATELSDKLTDSLNLQVIEPILKVHRAYRYILQQPQCDRYVLCQLNADAAAASSTVERTESRGLITGISTKIIKIGSMGAAFFISTETGTPFATLFSIINKANNCEKKYPVDCNGFHEGEAKVTTEYAHNEL